MRFALSFLAVLAFASTALIVHAQDPLPVTKTVHAAPAAPLPHAPLLEAMPGGDMKVGNNSARIIHFHLEGGRVVTIPPLQEVEFIGNDEQLAKATLEGAFKPFVDDGSLVIGGLANATRPPQQPSPPTPEMAEPVTEHLPPVADSATPDTPETSSMPPSRHRR